MSKNVGLCSEHTTFEKKGSIIRKNKNKKGDGYYEKGVCILFLSLVLCGCSSISEDQYNKIVLESENYRKAYEEVFVEYEQYKAAYESSTEEIESLQVEISSQQIEIESLEDTVDSLSEQAVDESTLKFINYYFKTESIIASECSTCLGKWLMLFWDFQDDEVDNCLEKIQLLIKQEGFDYDCIYLYLTNEDYVVLEIEFNIKTGEVRVWETEED